MIHDQHWFEMADKAKARMDVSSWVCLFSNETMTHLQYPQPGYWEEYFGATSILLPAEGASAISSVEWSDVFHSNRPIVDDDYLPGNVYRDWHSDLEGQFLVLQSTYETGDSQQVIVEPDLVLALRLIQEDDAWLDPYAGYVEVIRQRRDRSGTVNYVEIRNEYLKDYLCARASGLLVTTFRSRNEISQEQPAFELGAPWETDGANWEGRSWPITSDGSQYGSSLGVIRAGRRDVDADEDVPIFGPPSDANVWSERETYVRLGPVLYRTIGEMWRNEWISPGAMSPKVARHPKPSTIEFVIDAAGNRADGDALSHSKGRWLWFSASIVPDILTRRNTKLIWYTEQTGGLRLPAEGAVHFGINDGDLVNVYAKDVGQLSEYWQRIWAAHNVVPDAKVSGELLASQMKCEPADTVAAEKQLADAIAFIDEAFKARFGHALFREHELEFKLWNKIHRFVSLNETGFYVLAKDLTRLVVERFNVDELKGLTSKLDTKVGSLKRLENLVDQCGAQGREIVRPLVGVYELRHCDSHLPSSDVDDSLQLLQLDMNASWLGRGKEMIGRVAECLASIGSALQRKTARRP